MSNISQLICGNFNDRVDYLTDLLGLPGAGNMELEGRQKILENLNNQITAQTAKKNIFYCTLPKDKLSIGVENVAGLLEFASKKPHLSEQAIAIIFPAERLTAESQNKLLKLIEEPAEYLQVLILSDKESSLLATIRSRCKVTILEPKNFILDEQSTKLHSLLKGMLRDEYFLDQNYLELDTYIQRLKTNPEKMAALSTILAALGKEVEMFLSGNANSGIKKQLTWQDVTTLQQLLLKLNLGINYNANVKLIVDRLYLGLKALHR